MREVGVIDVDLINRCLLQNVITLNGLSTIFNSLEYNRKDLEDLFKYLDYINDSNIELESFYINDFINKVCVDWEENIKWDYFCLDNQKLIEFLTFLYFYDDDKYNFIIRLFGNLRGDGFNNLIRQVEYNIREESLNKILN